jgi:hypothetical protein
MNAKQLLKQLTCLFMLGSLLSGCAGMLENRTFIDEMDRPTDSLFVPGEDFSYTPGDDGVPHRSMNEVMQRTPASEQELNRRSESSSILAELAMKERKLRPVDRELYNQMRDQLESPSEKIYFLGLSHRDKLDYIQSRRIDLDNRNKPSRGIASLKPVYRSALNLGMSKDQVIDMWGRPARVEVAGNPGNENERWSFYESGSLRQVYFESGSVEGWNIQ